MRIVFTTLGTLGDLFPLLALGAALDARGHSVAVATAAAVADHVRNAGLEWLPCRPDMGPEEVRVGFADFDHWPTGEGTVSTAPQSDLSGLIRMRIGDLLAACHGADLLIHNSGFTGESVAAEALGTPHLRVLIAPERAWSPKHRKFLSELENNGQDSQDTEARNYFDWHQSCRREIGLPETPVGGWTGYFASRAILAASRHFLTPFDISSWNADVCGFWFHEPRQWVDWQPGPELAVFMERRPIVLSLSSQPVPDPSRIVEVHVEAARLLGRPILVQAGWAGLEGADTGDVMFRGFLPQDWLFARAACVIHHGGAGTTARALRHACPMLVEPWGNDQFFNAWMVLKGGWGTAVNPKKARPAELARLIEARVLSVETKARAELIAKRLADENGIGNAVTTIGAKLKIPL